MEQRSASPIIDEAPPLKGTLAFYSDNSPLSLDQWVLLRLVVFTPARSGEPEALSKARNRIKNAQMVLALHRESANSYLPPIFTSFEYQALCLLEKK